MFELSPINQLLTFGALAALYRFRSRNRAVLPTPAGAAVMAFGIFIVGPLQQMPPPGPLLTESLTIALIVVWGSMAVSYLTPAHGGLREHSRPTLGRFAIGTWVAATAVLARVVLLGVPEWRSLAVALAVLALLLWLWLLKIAAAALPTIIRTSSRSLTPGVVLLATVSTQSLALVASDLMPPSSTLDWIVAGMISAGILLYIFGATLVVFSHIKAKGWTIARDWDNTNCILHGAISISGLALTSQDMIPPTAALITWYCAFAAFIAVESVEVLRLVLRVRQHGWGKGMFSYRVTQWSRNFTFGMFYAFTLQLADPAAGLEPIAWMPLVRTAIVDHGPYLVLAVLLVELFVYSRNRFHVRRVLAINPWLHNPRTRRGPMRDRDGRTR